MQSNAFTLSAVFASQLQPVAAARGAAFQDNPPWPLDANAAAGPLLFLLTQGDRLQDQPGQREERRRLRVVVGALAPAKAGRALADALHFAARDRLKSLAFRQAVLATSVRCEDLREVEIEPELRGLTVEGAMLMSAYEIDYFQTYPSFGA